MITDPIRSRLARLFQGWVGGRRQDTVGVWAFRRHLGRYVLGWTLLGATLVIVIGYWFAASVSGK